MSKWIAVAAALFMLAVLLVVMSAALLGGTTSNTACGFGGPAQQVEGVRLDPEQLANARTIVLTTGRAGMSARAGVVAVATALQESGLRNLHFGDRDSLGLFQQRASWGPADRRVNPVAAAGLFLAALSAVPRWEALPITVASDKVQHSAFPAAVAKWQTVATSLVSRNWPTSFGASTSQSNLPAQAFPLAGPGADCPGQGGEGNGGGGRTNLPPSFTLPTGTQQAAVVRFALAQLGKPYLWGGTGPNGWDCSGLAMRSWGTAGVPLPRTTFQQVLAGAPVPSAAQLQPGDLIFIGGSDGTPEHPGHVGLYIGLVNSQPYLVNAPQTGKTVEVKPVSAWRTQIVAMRRPTTSTPSKGTETSP